VGEPEASSLGRQRSVRLIGLANVGHLTVHRRRERGSAAQNSDLNWSLPWFFAHSSRSDQACSVIVPCRTPETQDLPTAAWRLQRNEQARPAPAMVGLALGSVAR